MTNPGDTGVLLVIVWIVIILPHGFTGFKAEAKKIPCDATLGRFLFWLLLWKFSVAEEESNRDFRFLLLCKERSVNTSREQ